MADRALRITGRRCALKSRGQRASKRLPSGRDGGCGHWAGITLEWATTPRQSIAGSGQKPPGSPGEGSGDLGMDPFWLGGQHDNHAPGDTGGHRADGRGYGLVLFAGILRAVLPHTAHRRSFTVGPSACPRQGRKGLGGMTVPSRMIRCARPAHVPAVVGSPSVDDAAPSMNRFPGRELATRGCDIHERPP